MVCPFQINVYVDVQTTRFRRKDFVLNALL